MVTYIKSDLEFILKQIQISEAHALYVQTEGAEGAPLFGPSLSGNPASIPTYNIAWGLRTVDGSYNHLLPGQEQWGAADREFVELLTPTYRTVTAMIDFDGPGPNPAVPVDLTYTPGVDADGPGPNAGPGDVIDASVRTISNLLVDQTLGNPAAILTALQRAGIDDPGFAITASIRAAFEPIKPLFAAVTAADLAYTAAQAAANANPGDAVLAAAAAMAQQELADAQAALDAASGALDALLAANGIVMDGENIALTNVAPDEGLSASFNSWFTLFGQFFDHGLDLVNKGGSGTVMIPLQPDDPLYSNEPGALNFMVLTRATVGPGADGIMVDNPLTAIDESADNTRPVNTTTPFVDQNQTYTSHPSHQVFLREYVLNADDEPVATGKLIEGANGGMATWAELKAQTANLLGIQLADIDVGKVPLLRTDPYGNFIPGANGLPQLVIGLGPDGIPNTSDDVVVEGVIGAAVDPTAVGAIRTNHGFLVDIAHNAVPDGIEDGDTEVGGNIPEDGEYDNELLDAHFIAGDGRVNENIGLTAVHHVFHAEHNRLVQHTKDTLFNDAQALVDAGASQAEAVAFLNDWLADEVTELPADPNALVWNGERLFQAAKFGTEMQYQHLVFEEFARKVQPTINAFLVPDGFDTTMNPTIVAEFAHVVYRFGHSMLTESIDRFNADFVPDHITLIQGFLNPTAFNGVGGVIDDEVAAAAVIRGMTRQVGNEIDEFVTSALRNNLLGLPLDLATINLARGRDTGVPSLNEARADFYEASNQNILLKPYESWVDFASHLKHEASIINFIAAYGTHSTIVDAETIEGKRDAAMALVGLTTTGSETVALSNASFEVDSLAAGEPNVIVDALGNYTLTPPTGWSMGGTGGLFDPAAGVTNPAAIDGTNVVWLGQGGVLSRDTGVILEEGATYSLSFDIGDRTDTAWPGGTARLVSTNGTILAELPLAAPADGNWSTVTFETAAIGAAVAGQTLNIVIEQSGSSGDQILVDDIQLNVLRPLVPLDEGDRQDFLNGTGAYAENRGGLDLVDLWIGGLAEEIMPFGGMLGSTFNFVFEVQMEMLQSGDRFYYLQRLDGLHLFGEMENNSFAGMIMRNTEATHLPSDVFSVPGLILEVDQSRQFNDLNGDGVLESTDPLGTGILTQLVIRNNPTTVGPDTNYLRYTGGDHVLLGGTDPGNAFNVSGNDVLIGGIGDDTLYGDGGNDFLNGGFGNDIINGGDGDDIIVDSGGDDNIKGGAGNDVIHAGPGLDLVLAGSGHDFVFLGTDEGSEVFAGEGNDYIYGNKNAERILGNEGDDWIETGTFDGAPGDNFDEIFAQDSVNGHDVFLGDGGFDEFIGEGGDDIMVGSAGRGKMVGMSGFDWATYKDNTFGVNADIGIPIVFDESPVLPENASLDEYESVEGLSGTAYDDVLTGTDETAATLLPLAQGGSGGGFAGSMLNAEGIARIAGLQEVLGAGVTEFGSGDIILGGAGSDIITGKAGDDVIDGDKWLNVRIAVHESVGASGGIGTVIEYHDSMTTLAARMFSGEINPGQLRIHREIMTADGTGDIDIAVFGDVMANYTLTRNDDGSITVAHTTVSDGLESDGVDRVNNIEMLRFSDQDYSLVKPVVMLNALVGGTYRDNFNSNSYGNSDGTVFWGPDWDETGDNDNPANGQIQITGSNLRFDSGDGASIARTLNLAGATSAQLILPVVESGLDGGGDNDNIQVQFAADGASFVTIATINSATNTQTLTIPLTGPFTANAAIRFEASSLEDTEFVDFANLTIEFTAPPPSTDYATTYTENGAGVPIANSPSITDNGTTLVSAKILLTNAQLGDDFDWGALPGGISASQDSSVEGQLAVNLTGTASLANYQAAIQAVTFDSSSNDPSTVDRIIEVTVNDGFAQSDPAITTITVIATNDAPIGSGDSVITNFGANQVFNIPTWALLANDVDPEGSPHNITAVNGATGLNSLALVGDNVAVSDNATANGSFNYNVSDGTASDTSNTVQITRNNAGIVNGTTGDNIMIGNSSSSTFDAQGGNDIILAGDGADTIDAGTGDDRVFGEGGLDNIVWNANTSGDTDGFDMVDGGLGTDTFRVITRAFQAETYRVYTRTAAEAAGILIIGATTEIVITRQVGATTSIIAELDNIEEIRIGNQPGDPTNGGAGGSPGDTVQIFGDFTETSLALNTITIDGNAGDDTIDISSLDSAHRIVFRSNGGNDTIVGNLRPEDVIELPNGATIDNYVKTVVDGVTTLTNGDHSITYTAAGEGPQVGPPDVVEEVPEEPEGEPPVVGPVPVAQIGTPGNDLMTGTEASDHLIGFAGDDVLIGLGGKDILLGNDGNDFLAGWTGEDSIFGGAGDDTIVAGEDADLIYGDDGDDRIFADGGNDMVTGGAGNDTVVGGAGDDMIVAGLNDGDDAYFGDEINGGSGIDTLDMSAITANAVVDLGIGMGGRGSASSAQSGSDTLWGIENVVTGSGNDTIVASNAVNVMDGGAGNDTFVFKSIEAANGDTIIGFETGDKLDFGAIDANTTTPGNQAFTLVNGAQITGVGQLLISTETRADGDYTVIEGNVGNDDAADFKVSIRGTHDLTASDFIL